MANKAVFLDRDDTLIDDPGYINHPSQVKLLSGVSQALVQLGQMGYKIIVVSNQSAVARGIVTEAVLVEIHNRLEHLLGREGAYIDRIYYCPYHPDGVIPQYRKDSDLRKPNPGMLLKAASEMDIDLEQSWMIGNSYRDVAAGQKAGCRTILINSSIKPALRKPQDPPADNKAVNLKEAVNIIKMRNRQAQTNTAPAIKHTVEPAITEPESAEPQQKPTITEPQHEIEGLMTDKPSTGAGPKDKNTSETGNIEQLLHEILRHLKSSKRSEMFEEFSAMKYVAGILQSLVFLCLLISVVFILDPQRSNEAVLIALGYAVVIQLGTIAFYIMWDKKK